MRKIIKDYLAKEYDNYGPTSTAATAIWKAQPKPINL